MDPLWFLGIMVIFVVVMMFASSRARKKQREQRDTMLKELQPGTWVRTIGRMYGRIVDIDDRIVVLESLDGTELMFSVDAIAAIEEPHFSGVDEAAGSDTDATDETADPAAATTVPADVANAATTDPAASDSDSDTPPEATLSGESAAVVHDSDGESHNRIIKE